MSTRSTIQIQQYGEITASIYRHWDGYLAETGADLLAAVVKAGTNPQALLVDLLTTTEEPTSYDPKPRHTYELEPIHGDIEHYYRIQYDDRTVSIAHAWRSYSDDNMTEADQLPALAQTFSVPDFAQLVNKDRQEINARIIARGINSDPYPMVEVPAYTKEYAYADVITCDLAAATIARNFYPASKNVLA